MPTFSDVEAAARVLEGNILRTPLLRADELDEATGGRIFVKADCLQITGSFKLRGAFNRLSQLSDEEKTLGVVACSSGNHGQAIAYSAKRLGTSATIIMPEDAPRIKVDKTRAHGARIITYDRASESRESIAARISSDTGAVFVSPYDDPFVIAGQGTSALEALQDMAALGVRPDAYLVCCGGGGLLAGSALVLSHLSPETKIYSVEPDNYDDHARSFAAGERVALPPGPPPTICDALLPPIPGELTFQINKNRVTGGLTVSDNEVRQAMRLAIRDLKVVAEPGGAAALAAALAGKIDLKDKVVGLIISGGNVDPAFLAETIKD